VPRHLGVDPQRVVVMPNGVDLEQIARATPDDPEAVVREAFPSLAGARPLLLSVGRIEGYKGFDDIRRALERLKGRPGWPDTWGWIVVGEGPERRRLMHRSRPLGERVAWPGRLDEAALHALYAHATAFVHATHDEGSSLVTLEAMAHGLPVLASRAGGIPDKIQDGVSGRLVPPGDIEALGRGLLELASAPEAWRAMGERGRLRVRADFSWSNLAERTMALYEELVREGH
jgi:glycosyltransferase involved in cell wall biosynthesis